MYWLTKLNVSLHVCTWMSAIICVVLLTYAYTHTEKLLSSSTLSVEAIENQMFKQ